MTDGYVELPESQRMQPQRAESLPPLNRDNRRVYLAVIIVLGTVLIIGVTGWLILAITDRTMPDGLGVVLGTVTGGLVGLISTQRDGPA